QRLRKLADRLESVGRHLTHLDKTLGGSVESRLRREIATAAEATIAADAAARPSFEAEPLSGTGSPLWRAMWDAACRFSEATAYPNREFPVLGSGALCLMCQQHLGQDAEQRLE